MDPHRNRRRRFTDSERDLVARVRADHLPRLARREVHLLAIRARNLAEKYGELGDRLVLGRPPDTVAARHARRKACLFRKLAARLTQHLASGSTNR